MTVRATLAILLLLVGTRTEADDGDYRASLLAALDLRDRALVDAGREAPASHALRRALLAADPDTLPALTPHLPPASELNARLARAAATLSAAYSNAPAPRIAAATAKAIDFPEPDPISDCVDASASATQALLEAWSASNEVLAAAKWACLQTEAGTNLAELCTVIAVETELIEGDLDRQSFCLGAQRDAVLAAFSQTQSNVVDFINERADATIGSRATQDSVDALQTTLDSLLLRLAELRASLIEDDSAIALGLTDMLADAMGLAAQLTALSADSADVRFRIQAVQVDVEDAQRRLADVQTLAVRLADTGEDLRTRMESIRTGLSGARSALQGADETQLDRRLATALGDPDVVVLRYRLPAANGGELERSREILIRTLSAYQTLGADTSAALALLATGDAAYNAGRALDAYEAFAQAYRLLLDTQTTLSVVIMRNSFE